MNAPSIIESAIIFCLVANGWAINRLLTHVMRSREQIGKLARRVWILEGSPKCDHDQSELEA